MNRQVVSNGYSIILQRCFSDIFSDKWFSWANHCLVSMGEIVWFSVEKFHPIRIPMTSPVSTGISEHTQ